MKDGKSSFLSIAPSLVRNLISYSVSRASKHRFLRRVLGEFKAVGGRIEPIFLNELPMVSGVSVTTGLVSGAVVALVAKAIDARQMFEFGTNLGETAMFIAENCPNCDVVTLDLPDGMTFEEANQHSPLEITDRYLFNGRCGTAIRGEAAKRIEQIRQDSATFDPGPFAARFDLIYIDGSHSYSAVKEDSGKAFVMLKPGGTIIWDDYLYPGVYRYLNELAEARPDLKLRYLYDWGKVILLHDQPTWCPNLNA